MFDWSYEKLFCSLVAGAAAIRASFTRLLLSILQKYLVKAKVQQLLINPLLHSLHQAQAWARMHATLLELQQFEKGTIFTLKACIYQTTTFA